MDVTSHFNICWMYINNVSGWTEVLIIKPWMHFVNNWRIRWMTVLSWASDNIFIIGSNVKFTIYDHILPSRRNTSLMRNEWNDRTQNVEGFKRLASLLFSHVNDLWRITLLSSWSLKDIKENDLENHRNALNDGILWMKMRRLHYTVSLSPWSSQILAHFSGSRTS